MSEDAELSETAKTETSPHANPNASESESSETKDWFWAESVKGEGERPEFLLDKYQKVSDQAKGYKDLERKLGGFTGAPEAYEFEHLGLDPEQATLQAIVDVGKELNMSQKGMDQLVGRLMSAQETEKEHSLEGEITKLGDEGDRIMKQYKYFKENYMQPEEGEIVSNWIRTAEDLKVFTAMTKGIYSKRVPTENDAHLHNHHDTIAGLDKEMADNLERFNKDEVYRKDLRARRQSVLDRGKR